jgi:hypothetical protein
MSLALLFIDWTALSGDCGFVGWAMSAFTSLQLMSRSSPLAR